MWVCTKYVCGFTSMFVCAFKVIEIQYECIKKKHIKEACSFMK